MKTLLLALILSGTVYAIERPPVPTDVPFAWDPNLCPSPAFDWMVVTVGESIVYTFHVVNLFGEDVILTTSDPNITSYRLDKTNEGEYWLQTFQLFFTSFSSGLNYINLNVVDQYERSDDRTLLIMVLTDDPPIIYPPDRPVITGWIKGAQQLCQIAKKQGRNIAGIVHVWNPRRKLTM